MKGLFAFGIWFVVGCGTEAKQQEPDGVAPTWGGNSSLTVSELTAHGLTLAWTAATDNVSVTQHRIGRDGNTLATVSGDVLRYEVKGLEDGKSYVFDVQAGDAAGNWSTDGPTLEITTPDVTAPAWPSGELLVSDVTATSVKLTWGTATDNVGITQYVIHVDENKEPIATLDASEREYTVTGLVSAATYQFRVEARDEAGNESTDGPTAMAMTLDNIAPTWSVLEGALGASDVTATSARLTWTAATDNVGVTSYRVYRDEVLRATPVETTYTDSELTELTSYRFRVEAIDATENVSAEGPSVEVRTLDGTRPVWPEESTLLASDVNPTSLTLAWTEATDNVGVTAYVVYQGISAIATTDALTRVLAVTALVSGMAYEFRVEAHDSVGLESEGGPTVSVTTPDNVPPIWPDGSALTATEVGATTVTLSWSVATDNVGVTVYDIYQGDMLLDTVPSLTTTYQVTALLPVTEYTFEVEAGDLVENWSTEGPRLTVTTMLPPDPIEVATTTPIDPTTATPFWDSNSFLWDSPNSVQADVVVAEMEPLRMAVLRGKVLDRDGLPLAGAKVSVPDHPEYGFTLTREGLTNLADAGFYDLAVNGGGQVTLRFEKEGYLPVERNPNVPLASHLCLEEVVLIQPDPVITEVDLAEPVSHIAEQGELSVDTSGERKARVYFPSDTRARMVFEDQSPEEIVNPLEVCITEYTVGERGPQAMPAPLPPNSAYTYALDLAILEAVDAGAKHVEFCSADSDLTDPDGCTPKPVYVYVDNFIGMPVGEAIPVAEYDPGPCAAWIPSDNGRVIKLVAIGADTGLAELDTDGFGGADYEGLGIDDEERRRIAELFSPDQEFWRVGLTQFSKPDFNLANPGGSPTDGNGPRSSGGGNGADPSKQCHSTIYLGSQSLGEALPVVGTPFALHYRSDRVPGRREARSLEIPLSSATIPLGLERIDVVVDVGGKVFPLSFPAAPDQTYTFEWDGIDAYGRFLQGAQPIRVRTGYVYDGEYGSPRRFGQNGLPIPGVPMRTEQIAWREWEGQIGALANWQQLAPALGGWSLNVHHMYDPRARVLYLGDGTKRTAEARQLNIVTRAAGLVRTREDGSQYTVRGGPEGTRDGGPGWGDGGPARERAVSPVAIAADGDGNIWFGNDWDTYYSTLRKLDPTTDTLTSYAASIWGGIAGLDAAPDGGIFLSGGGGIFYKPPHSDVLVRINKDDWGEFEGDGEPLPNAVFDSPIDIAVASDCTLFIADMGNSRIRRVEPGRGRDGLANGRVETVAGGGNASTAPDGFGDGGLATDAIIYAPTAVDVGPDGSIYFMDRGRVRRVAPDGIISTVAGGGSPADGVGDGGPATEAQLASDGSTDGDVLVGPDGSLYIGIEYPPRIRHVDPAGIITTIAGNGTRYNDGDRNWSEDDKPATGAAFSGSYDHRLALAPDGSLYVADKGNALVRRIRAALPGTQMDDIIIPSEDGSEIYKFDRKGCHQETWDALTGAVLYRFEYEAGRLVRIIDPYANITVIRRNADGIAESIEAPFGQVTTLTVDPSSGYLTQVQGPGCDGPLDPDPDCQITSMTYGDDGLLTQLIDTEEGVHNYAYDTVGRLIRDEGPDEAAATLSREVSFVDRALTNTVTFSSPEGRGEEFSTVWLPSLKVQNVFVDPVGLSNTMEQLTNGSSTTSLTDDTTIETLEVPDPRFGMMMPYVGSLSMETPAGLEWVRTATRSVVLEETDNPFTMSMLTHSTTVNGRAFQTVFDKTAGTITTTSAAGRQSQTTVNVLTARNMGFDPDGAAAADLLSVAYSYDDQGRLTQLTQGDRMAEYTYGSDGWVSSMTYGSATDESQRWTASFAYDLVGRLLSETLPDGRMIGYTYDRHGNRLSVTPPGPVAGTHGFEYTVLDLASEYDPPLTEPTRFEYDRDRNLVRTTYADGGTLDFGYDSAGRLETITMADDVSTIAYAYDSAGRISDITMPDGSGLAYLYDGSLVTGEVWAGGSPEIQGSVLFTYDNDFRVTREQVVGTSAVDYGYDADSLLTSAGAMQLAYDAETGVLSQSEVGSGDGRVVETWSYDGYGEVSEHVVRQGATDGVAPVFREAFTRDTLGRIVTKVETIQGETSTYDYGYDVGLWLIRVTRTRDDVVTIIGTYDYDANGNRTGATTEFLGMVTGEYDSQDRVITYGGESYGYDARGQLVTSGTRVYTYDDLERLTEADVDGTHVEYRIDGEGRRIGKVMGGALVQGFLYTEQIAPVAELGIASEVVARFVYATWAHVPDLMIRDGVTYRIVSDTLGSPRVVINTATGAIEKRLDYDEFGNITSDSAPEFALPFGFAGGLYDSITKLTHFGAREYDARLGRFTTTDPLLFDGGDTNLYGYVLNDPINAVDPYGLIVPVIVAVCATPLGQATILGTAGMAGVVVAPYIAAAASQIAAAMEGDTLDWSPGVKKKLADLGVTPKPAPGPPQGGNKNKKDDDKDGDEKKPPKQQPGNRPSFGGPQKPNPLRPI